MAFEQVGVEAVVEGMSLFNRHVGDFNKGIGGMVAAAVSTGAGIVLNPIKAFGGALLNVFETALGFITRDVFNFIAGGISRIAGQAVTAAGNFQQLEIQLEGLIAQQLRQASGTTQMVEAGQEFVELTDKQQAELEKLQRQYALLGPQIEVAREKLSEDIAEGKLSQAEIELRQAKLADMEQRYASLSDTINNYQASNHQLVSVLREVRTGQISLNEAMEQAGPAARELVDWIADFAAKSTITVQGMTNMVRGFLTLDGVGVDSAKRLTNAVAVWGAQMGLTEDQLGRIVDNIIQTSRSSKITERDLREFGNAGLNLTLIFDTMAQAMGTSREEAMDFAKSGKEGVAAFLEAVQSVAETEFPDAMNRLASTWNVAMSNIQDVIESVFGREVLGPALANVAGFISGIIDKVLGARQAFRDFGVGLGQAVQGIIDVVGPLLDMFLSSNSLEVKIGYLRAVLENWGTVLIEWITRQIPKTLIALYTWLGKLLDWAGSTSVRSPLIDALAKMGQTFVDWVGPLIPPLLGKLYDLINNKVLPWIREQVTGLTQTLATWAQEFIDWVAPLVGPLIEQLQTKVLPPILDWLDARVKDLNDLFVNKWAPAFWEWIDENAPSILAALGRMAGQILGWFAGEGAREMGNAFALWLTPMKNGGDNLALTFVGSFIKGLWEGLTKGISQGAYSFQNDLAHTITVAIQNAINQAKAALGIYSPSRLTMTILGEPLGQGVAQGILSSMGDIAGAFQASTMAAMSAAAPAAAQTSIYSPNTTFALTLHSPVPADVPQSFAMLEALHGGGA